MLRIGMWKYKFLAGCGELPKSPTQDNPSAGPDALFFWVPQAELNDWATRSRSGTWILCAMTHKSSIRLNYGILLHLFFFLLKELLWNCHLQYSCIHISSLNTLHTLMLIFCHTFTFTVLWDWDGQLKKTSSCIFKTGEMTTSEHWLQYSSPLKRANNDGKTQRMEKLSIIKSKHKQTKNSLLIS